MTNYKIYFAGDLFDHKHLIGNRLLADNIRLLSSSKFDPVLPQDHEQASFRATDIRDSDYELLVQSDVAFFNFDGTDLDSGTVAEFMVAKALDIPSVIIRTDFRRAGDLKDGPDWNLMLSSYPRSEIVTFNAMEVYQGAKDEGQRLLSVIYSKYSLAIINAFEKVLKEEPLWDTSNVANVYNNTIKSLGQTLAVRYSDQKLLNILAIKLTKEGLIRSNHITI